VNASVDLGNTEGATPPRKVPVTIVTGFLGAGKTTLLNYILTSSEHGKRIAVIENEFGDEKGIERLIARGPEGDKQDLDNLFVELTNGCICCAVRDDLVVTLEGLLEKSDKFDYIMIETSGVADPGPLVGVFWLDHELESRIYLDGIVTVIDAKNLVQHLDDPNKQETYVNEAQKQIAYADRLLLNKQDLVSPSEMSNIQKRAVGINPFAKIMPTTNSKVDLDFILNVRGYENIENHRASVTFQQDLLQLETSSALFEHSHSHSHSHAEEGCTTCSDEAQPRHDPSVRSVVVRVPEAIDLKRLEAWIGQLLWERATITETMNIFRIKGIVRAADSDAVHLIQGVHETFEVEPSSEKWGSPGWETPGNRIVFIGRSVDLEILENGIKSCIPAPST